MWKQQAVQRVSRIKTVQPEKLNTRQGIQEHYNFSKRYIKLRQRRDEQTPLEYM